MSKVLIDVTVVMSMTLAEARALHADLGTRSGPLEGEDLVYSMYSALGAALRTIPSIVGGDK